MGLAVLAIAIAANDATPPTHVTGSEREHRSRLVVALGSVPRSIGDGSGTAADIGTPTSTVSPTPPTAPATPMRDPFVWPADGWFTQAMTAAHPAGIDIGLETGAPVRAVRSGRVTFAGGDVCCVYGYHVIVEHDGGWTSLYAHLSSIDVNVGERIAQGSRVGGAGATGKASGPHLHFELRRFGWAVDPLRYLEHRPGFAERVAVVVQAPRSLPEPTAARPVLMQPEPTAPTSAPSARGEVIAATMGLMAGEIPLGYALGAGACGAASTAQAQWLVTCSARAPGCGDEAVCVLTRSYCVIEEPLTVWSC